VQQTTASDKEWYLSYLWKHLFVKICHVLDTFIRPIVCTLGYTFGHHADSVLEGLSLVAEPDSNDFSLIAKLVCQCSYFST